MKRILQLSLLLIIISCAIEENDLIKKNVLDAKRDSIRRLDSIRLDSIRLDSIKMDSIRLDSIRLDSIKLATFKIKTNLKPDTIIPEKEFLLDVNVNYPVEKLSILIDNQLQKTYDSIPYSMPIFRNDYADGNHELKVIAQLSTEQLFEKIINFKIDNTGPIVEKLNLPKANCGIQVFKPIISDSTSKVKKVKLFIEGSLVNEIDSDTDFSFTIDQEKLNVGLNTAKLVMEDEVGNISESVFELTIKKHLVSVELPYSFTRSHVEKFYILLSDKDGNYLDHKIYSDQSETIEFCSSKVFDSDTEYMLTFFEVFDNSIFNVFCYSNLSKNTVGKKITLKQRTQSNSSPSVNLDLSNVNLNHFTRASGLSYSMAKINNQLSGHTAGSFENGLGTFKTFIMSYNYENSQSNYKWAFIDDVITRTSLTEQDFSTEKVVSKNITFSKSINKPFLEIYGFEDDRLYNVLNAHDIYSSQMFNVTPNMCSYQYADLFNHYFYSLRANNYYISGKGIPKENYNIPNYNINFSLNSDKLSFNGLTNFEVGRITIENESAPGEITIENPTITVEFIFDGKENVITIPKIPQGIFPEAAYQAFNLYSFKPIQGIAENYSSYNSYEDYIKNVLVTSKPFYITSDYRERVFYSYVSQHILPVWEFPFHTRF